MTTAPHTLTVRDLTHRFDERLVLDGVDLDVEPGRILGLLGPNGAGKTTLMRIIFGVLDPDVGQVCWGGRPATADDRRRWGYMPQQAGLYRDMRTLDHLVWLGRLYGLDGDDARRRAELLLGRLGLAERADDVIRELSGGMAQRAQLAAALVHDPDLLVLDEPFAGLDPAAVDSLSTVVRDHVARGGHLVFSSHQLDLVEDLCESVTLIDEGQVVMNGAVRDLKRASGDRYLQVDVAVDDAWLDRAPARVVTSGATESRLLLEPDADAAAVLDVVRSHCSVDAFAVDSPTLSELFLAATGRASR